MRAVFGLLLIMLGLAMAVVWMPEHNGERQLAVVTDIATQGINSRRDGADRGGRTFSPHTPLLATVEQAGARQPQHVAGVARVVPAAAAPPSDPVQQVATTASTVVTDTFPGSSVIGPVAVVTPAVRAIDASPGSRPPAPPEMSRDDLVRNLQRELKRVGCYAGDVDGDWGTGSRRAMSSFTDRVNASLPIEQPDFILLTLLRSQPGNICGRTCPSGQVLSDSGRCLPNAVVAQSRSIQDRRLGRDNGASTEPASVQTAAVPQAPATDGGWTSRVTRSTGSTELVAAAAAATAGVAVAAAAIPGRMSMGGPQSGAYAVPPAETSPARDAVRAAQPQDERTAEPARRDRSRRTARRNAPTSGFPVVRYGYGPPVVVYRAPRIAAPSSYSSAPRRSGRSWTATFFGNL